MQEEPRSPRLSARERSVRNEPVQDLNEGGDAPQTNEIKAQADAHTLGGNVSDNSSPTSPLLLGMDVITPLTSKDEDTGVFSDSDIASQASYLDRGRSRSYQEAIDPLTIAANTNNTAGMSAIAGQTRLRTPSKNKSSSRRRRSDSSEKSGRSSSSHHEKISPSTKIFRNLLILEESLRQQSIEQKSLRRKFTTFLTILAGIEGAAFYSLYCSAQPPQHMKKVVLQFMFFFLLITLVLFHLSGEYRRTIVIPRKFFTSTNKGIRQFNLRLVKVKTSIPDKITDWVRTIMLITVQLLIKLTNYMSFFKSYRIVISWHKLLRNLEIQAQPRVGAVDVKLVLNPRAFNAEIREAWEIYRDEFWAREGARRRHVSLDESKEDSNDALMGNFAISSSSSGGVMDKSKLMERHKRERKDRRKSEIARALVDGTKDRRMS